MEKVRALSKAQLSQSEFDIRSYHFEGMGKALPGMLLHIRGWQENRCLYVSGGGLSGSCGYSDWYKSEIDL